MTKQGVENLQKMMEFKNQKQIEVIDNFKKILAEKEEDFFQAFKDSTETYIQSLRNESQVPEYDSPVPIEQSFDQAAETVEGQIIMQLSDDEDERIGFLN